MSREGFREQTNRRKARGDEQEALYARGEKPLLKVSITAMTRNLLSAPKLNLSTPYRGN
jgi:hypothetical protein